jgi:hypothetical protein
MTESKSQDKYYPYGLKHEGFENFNWPSIEPEFDDFRNSNFALMNKMANRGQIFGDFGQNPMNPEALNDQISLPPQSENQNPIIDQTDQTNRMHTNYPIFNEKLLSNNNNPPELGLNPMKNQYQSLVMNNINKLPPYALPNNYYFPFNNNNLRRPLPSELLEEEPVYVNPKQYERIMKLRIKKAQRGMLKNSTIPVDKNKDSYKHLSRHLHAKRRERGTGGRFLSKEAQKKKDEEDEAERLRQIAMLGEHPDFDALAKNPLNE